MKRVDKWMASFLAVLLFLVLGVGCSQPTDSSEVAELRAQVEELQAQVVTSTTTVAPTTTTTTTVAPTTTTTTAPTTTKPEVRVATSDVAIDYIVLDESCFGSAGSLVQVEMSPTLAPGSSLSLDDFGDLRLLVTFDITNTEDGVTRGSFEIDRGRYNSKTDRLSFARCNTLPNIVVTKVTAR